MMFEKLPMFMVCGYQIQNSQARGHSATSAAGLDRTVNRNFRAVAVQEFLGRGGPYSQLRREPLKRVCSWTTGV